METKLRPTAVDTVSEQKSEPIRKEISPVEWSLPLCLHLILSLTNGKWHLTVKHMSSDIRLEDRKMVI